MQHSSFQWLSSRERSRPQAGPVSPAPKTDNDAIVIKKYANRRLYNTLESRYITLDHLARKVKDGQPFVVIDARTGSDITRNVLMQIVVDAEGREPAPLLSPEFLRGLIRFYDDPLHAALPPYLEASIAALDRNRNKVRRAIDAIDTPGDTPLSELIRRNLAILEQAADMAVEPDDEAVSNSGDTVPDGAAKTTHDQMDALKRQLDLMQAEIERLAVNKKG